MNDIMKNSVDVQVTSLGMFARALGYEVGSTGKEGKNVTFYSTIKANNRNPFISYNGMVALHNSLHSSRVNHVGDFQYIEAGGKHYTFPTHLVRQARAAKVVDVAGLHFNKSDGVWLSTKSFVRFCNNSYPLYKHLLED